MRKKREDELLSLKNNLEPTTQEKVRLYQLWKESGWSQGRFCQNHNIPLDKFAIWSSQIDTKLASNFCEVRTQSISFSHQETMSMELYLSNDIKCCVRGDVHQFAILFKEVFNGASAVR